MSTINTQVVAASVHIILTWLSAHRPWGRCVWGYPGPSLADECCTHKLPPRSGGSAHVSSPRTDSRGMSGRQTHWEASLCDRARGRAQAVASAGGEAPAGSQVGPPLLPVGALCLRRSPPAEGGSSQAVTACRTSLVSRVCISTQALIREPAIVSSLCSSEGTLHL